jgi:hypothetical protein
MDIRRWNPGFVEYRYFGVAFVVVKTTLSRRRSQLILRPQKSQPEQIPSFYIIMSGSQISLRKALELKFFFKKYCFKTSFCAVCT